MNREKDIARADGGRSPWLTYPKLAVSIALHMFCSLDVSRFGTRYGISTAEGEVLSSGRKILLSQGLDAETTSTLRRNALGERQFTLQVR
jgi:hypothetical protein